MQRVRYRVAAIDLGSGRRSAWSNLAEWNLGLPTIDLFSPGPEGSVELRRESGSTTFWWRSENTDFVLEEFAVELYAQEEDEEVDMTLSPSLSSSPLFQFGADAVFSPAHGAYRMSVPHDTLDAALAAFGVDEGEQWNGFWSIHSTGVHPDISVQVSVDASEPCPITMTRDGELTSIDESIPEQVQVFRLDQNYPNPFNPTTTISFGLPEPGHVQMRIYDMTGRLMTELVDQPLMAGEHTVSWNAAGVSSGVYMYQLHFQGAVQKQMLTVMK